MTHDTRTPQPGCRCTGCRAARARLWRGLTEAQRRALRALHRAVPRHQTDLARRDGVRRPTLDALLWPHADRPALIHEHRLGVRNYHTPTMPFFTLNQDGAEILAEANRTARHHERKVT